MKRGFHTWTDRCKAGMLAKWACWQGGLLHRVSSSPGVCFLQGMLPSMSSCCGKPLVPQAPYPAGSLSPSVYLLDVPPRRIPSKRPGPTRPQGTRDREGKPSTYIPGWLCKTGPNNFTHEENTSSNRPTPPLGAEISITAGAYRICVCRPGRAYQADHQIDLPDACPSSTSAYRLRVGHQRSRRA
jgi:hypothetical protein